MLEEFGSLPARYDGGARQLYLLAQSHYKNEDCQNCSAVFCAVLYFFPRGEYTELARFYSGFGLAQNIPTRDWIKPKPIFAMRELQLFVDYFPPGERAEEAKAAPLCPARKSGSEGGLSMLSCTMT